MLHCVLQTFMYVLNLCYVALCDGDIILNLCYVADIRQQLNDQLKCLDWKQESQVSMLYELQDFFKRRAEVDMEYSKNLDRLVRQIMVRHKAEKQKCVTFMCIWFYRQLRI